MSEHPDLERIRLRVERARRHWEECDQLIAEWAPPDGAVGVESDWDPESEEIVFSVDRVLGFPEAALGLTVSDAIHQLRAALDNLWWSLAETNGSATRGSFPIFDRESDWLAKRSSLLRSVPDDVAPAIDRVQPFRAGPGEAHNHLVNHPLFQLARLSNKDKHRLLRPVLPGPGGFELTYRDAFLPQVFPVRSIGADRVFLRQPVDPPEFEPSKLWHSPTVTVRAHIQIPGKDYFAPLAGPGGVAQRVTRQVLGLIDDLAPFVKGERLPDVPDEDEDLRGLAWQIKRWHDGEPQP